MCVAPRPSKTLATVKPFGFKKYLQNRCEPTQNVMQHTFTRVFHIYKHGNNYCKRNQNQILYAKLSWILQKAAIEMFSSCPPVIVPIAK